MDWAKLRVFSDVRYQVSRVEKLWCIHDGPAGNGFVYIDKDTAICIIRHLALRAIVKVGYRIIHDVKYLLIDGDRIVSSDNDCDRLIYYTCLGLS